MPSETRTMVVDAAQHGLRIDRVLAHGVHEFSRSYLQQLLEQGLVRLQGGVVQRASQKVRAGEVLQVELRASEQSRAFVPESMALDVRYADEHLLVLHKPAGLVVHPAPGNWRGTLLNGLLAWHPDFLMLPRAGIVHRLDKDTSGLMVVARSRQAMDALVQSIAERLVRRQYLALAHGEWRGPREQRAEHPIGRDPRNRLRMAALASTPPGKPARTDFTCMDSVPEGCLVHCALHTGRTHQIRVHLAALGHPLLADELYGGRFTAVLQRQALHAYRLAFDHPQTGKLIELRAAPPADFEAAIGAWGLRYNFEQLP